MTDMLLAYVESAVQAIIHFVHVCQYFVRRRDVLVFCVKTYSCFDTEIRSIHQRWKEVKVVWRIVSNPYVHCVRLRTYIREVNCCY